MAGADRTRIDNESIAEHRGVDFAEVSGELRVADAFRVLRVWGRSVEAASDLLADQTHGGGGPGRAIARGHPAQFLLRVVYLSTRL